MCNTINLKRKDFFTSKIKIYKKTCLKIVKNKVKIHTALSLLSKFKIRIAADT